MTGRVPTIDVRPPAVAGRFYPADAGELRADINQMFEDSARAHPPETPETPEAPKAPRGTPEAVMHTVKALIAPHAGYVFSGPVAASAYRLLEPIRNKIRRVVLIGPAHYVPFFGLATTGLRAFETPLGRVPVDVPAVEQLCAAGLLHPVDPAHQPEHSLEVHLPFLQQTLESFSIVPILTGQTTPLQVSELFNAVWDGPETLIVVSSDLSHYHDYATARRIDAATTDAIESLQPLEIQPFQACGHLAIQGLLMQARQRHLPIQALDVRNSGDTAAALAGRDRVVGYGAYALYDQP